MDAKITNSNENKANPVNYSTQGFTGDPNKELGSAQRSIEALLSSGISADELNKELDAVKELASSGNDPMRTQSNLKEVLRKIEELDDSTEWQRVERELR